MIRRTAIFIVALATLAGGTIPVLHEPTTGWIEVVAAAGRTWVVINDPIAPGATIVSNLGGQSEMLADQAGGSGAQPSYVERGKDSWRGYFGWMPAGTHAVEYVVRLNGSGRFSLPPTRVEAMYSPAIRGQWPNGTLTVASVGQ